MVTGGAQAKLLGGEVANGAAVHGVVDGTRTRHDLYAIFLVVKQPLGAYGLNLRHDDVRPVFLHHSVERVAVEHAEHLALVGNLHRRGVVVAVAGYYVLPCPLGSYHELTAQFA